MSKDSEDFVTQHLDLLPDAWRRKEGFAPYILEFAAFGLPVHFASNHPALLEGARISASRYSRSAIQGEVGPIHLTFLLDRQRTAPPVPPDWPARLHYLASGPWMSIDAGEWGNGFAHLQHREALAILSEALAGQPYLYSRYLADSFLLNILMRSGLGQMHASCVYQSGKALLLCAPHNSGKSTTAFRLARRGYRMLSDGMTYIRPTSGRLELLGYPVGEVKLRLDMVGQFPELQGAGEERLVREDQKVVVNLLKAAPEQVLKESIFPTEIVLCLVERGDGEDTHAEKIDFETTRLALFPEIAHYDEAQVVRSNLAAVESLLHQARLYRLSLGSDEAGIFEQVERL
jgi:hypothetical protein